MPTFNEFIITKKSDIAWDGGKATENLIPNDGDLVFDSTGGGRSAHQAPLLDELGWATDNNRADTNGGDDTSSCSSGSLSVLYMDAPVGRDFSGDVNGDTYHTTGQVTFGGSITLQNILNGVHTLNDWFDI